jgi:hypothetical protein
MTREDGATYCFSNDEALNAFMNVLGWGTFVVADIQKTRENPWLARGMIAGISVRESGTQGCRFALKLSSTPTIPGICFEIEILPAGRDMPQLARDSEGQRL